MKIKRLSPTAKLPVRATEQSAGCDLCADITQSLTLAPGEIRSIPTGIAVQLPRNTVGLVFGRSGLGIRHGISPVNAVGVIDADYRGEIAVGLINHGEQSYCIEPGERIAQLVVVPVLAEELIEVDELDETQRGAGGFGSSGRV